MSVLGSRLLTDGGVGSVGPNERAGDAAPPSAEAGFGRGEADGARESSETPDAGLDGPALSDAGVADVTPPEASADSPPFVCGNGIWEQGEACDDSNLEGGDGCSADCERLEPGHACFSPGFLCSRVTACGDSVEDPSEQCDDGNLLDGDGCSAGCRLERGLACQGAPSSCAATVCSDGVVQGAEACDDGNQVSGDGCSELCLVEPFCNAGSGECQASCGDGVVMDGEECDDANLLDGDGCSAGCHVELGYACQESELPSTCLPSCGDGVLVPGEQCDDGDNDATYGGCGPDCRLVGYCGDSIVNGPEECEPGLTDGPCQNCTVP